jgi:hypothetical protein
VQEPRFALTSTGDEIAHVVCCREADWSIAFCGEPNDRIDLNATVVCTLCIEVAKGRHPAGDMYADPPICPNDGEPCPDDHEVDLRILREVST